MVVDSSVRKDQLQRIFLAGGLIDEKAVQPQILLFADRKLDVNGIDLRNSGQESLLVRSNKVTDVGDTNPRYPIDRRLDSSETQIQLSTLKRTASDFDLPLCGFNGSQRVVVFR